jgi:hypothetical protein
MVCFQTKPPSFGFTLEALLMENFYICYDHLIYIHTLWPFALFYGYLVYVVAIHYIIPI